MVGVNVPIPVPMAYYSFGGWRNSLFGDTHVYGEEGVRFYTRAKVVTARWTSGGGHGLRFSDHEIIATMTIVIDNCLEKSSECDCQYSIAIRGKVIPAERRERSESVARRAGIQQAAAATTSSSAVTPANVTDRSVSPRRAASQEACQSGSAEDSEGNAGNTSPSPCRATSRTCPGAAPSARRMPNSTRGCPTYRTSRRRCRSRPARAPQPRRIRAGRWVRPRCAE